MTSRLASATAQLTGWPPKVMPCRNEFVPSQEGLGEPVADEQAAERRVARRHALGEGDHVGLVAEAARAEPVAESAERADDLVGDQAARRTGRRSPAPGWK